MLPSSLQSTEFPLRFNIPGKIFVLGEYAVLTGHPAMVAAVAPRFELIADRVSELRRSHELTTFHLQSPAGKLIAWAETLGAVPLDFLWVDPHLGQGGFGGSTAQFALVYRALAEVQGWPLDEESVWKLYVELTTVTQGLPPSGADLLAQWKGGVALVDFNAGALQTRDLSASPVWENLLIFSAAGQPGRKVATHEHLEKFQDKEFILKLGKHLEKPLRAGISAVEEGKIAALGVAFDGYADVLQGMGLELEATTQDRRILRSLPGVLGVKGAGAMQADGILVALEPEVSAHSTQGAALRNRILQTAQARNLKSVTEGLRFQNGVRVGSCLH